MIDDVTILHRIQYSLLVGHFPRILSWRNSLLDFPLHFNSNISIYSYKNINVSSSTGNLEYFCDFLYRRGTHVQALILTHNDNRS